MPENTHPGAISRRRRSPRFPFLPLSGLLLALDDSVQFAPSTDTFSAGSLSSSPETLTSTMLHYPKASEKKCFSESQSQSVGVVARKKEVPGQRAVIHRVYGSQGNREIQLTLGFGVRKYS